MELQGRSQETGGTTVAGRNSTEGGFQYCRDHSCVKKLIGLSRKLLEGGEKVPRPGNSGDEEENRVSYAHIVGTLRGITWRVPYGGHPEGYSRLQ